MLIAVWKVVGFKCVERMLFNLSGGDFLSIG
jgi:hypothetical protein